MATITLTSITKVYPNGYRAVDEVDLDVADGEFMVLIGPSGCGKTTLLRMIAGLEEITGGDMRIGETVVNQLAPKDRDVAMVFQNYALYPHMTVAENIGFGLRAHKTPRPEIDRKVKDAAAILGLEPWIDRRPAQLSGGQRQRVAMGRAIVRDPDVFLMDEPLSNLDAKLRVQMRAEVSRIQRRLGVATVYVTHDQVEAMTMGDRVAVMNDGVILQCADPQTLYDQPASMFVAAFIGSPAMNLYEATLGRDLTAVRLGSQSLAIPARMRAARPELQRYAGGPIVVGLRPEDIGIANGTGGPEFAGTVDLVEALGSELLVYFTTDARRVAVEQAAADADLEPIGGEAVARVPPRAPVKPGESARFSVDIERMHFFDAATGAAVSSQMG